MDRLASTDPIADECYLVGSATGAGWHRFPISGESHIREVPSLMPIS